VREGHVTCDRKHDSWLETHNDCINEQFIGMLRPFGGGGTPF
jgi:hypothetical protein